MIKYITNYMLTTIFGWMKIHKSQLLNFVQASFGHILDDSVKVADYTVVFKSELKDDATLCNDILVGGLEQEFYCSIGKN